MLGADFFPPKFQKDQSKEDEVPRLTYATNTAIAQLSLVQSCSFFPLYPCHWVHKVGSEWIFPCKSKNRVSTLLVEPSRPSPAQLCSFALCTSGGTSGHPLILSFLNQQKKTHRCESGCRDFPRRMNFGKTGCTRIDNPLPGVD